MKSVQPNDLDESQFNAWNEYKIKRTYEIKKNNFDKKQFQKYDIEKKLWLEFLAYRNAFLAKEKNPFINELDFAYYTRSFGPDTHNLLRSFNHETISISPFDPPHTEIVAKAATKTKVKKPLSLYNFYFKKRLEELRFQNKSLTIQEISRAIGIEWRSKSISEKEKIEEDYFVEFGIRPN
ncbi:hypothetical protein TRFO_13860 [Tritrichomonas foetus]|uniref:HMG box domain-containing protein n=1 Tax=Tritrichomonas foetus TaxID=1144522 RepID=A0A1J4KWS2_9EUKA|nr:hypothetical protein TRFO_13860 [Tritrichomonas foetus]|eukprot:OHT15699.1 hypothetical protein TRFO_13860 [Tritrichomonas foetus]